MSGRLCAPEPLCADHDVSAFECGEASLDYWLKRRALTNQLSGASRTFVVLDENRFVVGYYALAAGAVAHESATGGVRRNMPDPIPVLVLGRLAVARRAQGLKLGAFLLQDAVFRAMAVSENVGVRALLVHALNETARAFYEHYGLQGSPLDPMTLMLRLHRPNAAV
jgi:GNAT superfamily N-acetyltransferase